MRGKALLWSSSMSVYHYWSVLARTSNCCFLCTDVYSLRLLTAETCPACSSPPVPYVLNIWRIWISEGRKLQPSLSFYSKCVCVLVLSLFPSCQFQDPSWTGHSRAHEVNRLHRIISAISNQLTWHNGKDIFFLTLAFIYMFIFDYFLLSLFSDVSFMCQHYLYNINISMLHKWHFNLYHPFSHGAKITMRCLEDKKCYFSFIYPWFSTFQYREVTLYLIEN